MLPTVTVVAATTVDYNLFYNSTDGKLHQGKIDGVVYDDAAYSGSGTTLTLTDFNFTTTAGIAMQLPADTTLVLNGTNTVTSTYNGSNHTYGIYTKGSMTVDGTGSLNAMGGLTSGEFSNSCGVYASGSINFVGGKLTNVIKITT